jgi:sugar-specific transcriptional regulator TrmB
MLINEDFLNRLRQSFSLNLYEVKLWAAILSRGISTAGELSDIADVPRSRTYDVLESLERKGFVVVKPEKPIKYMALPPTEVLDRVQKKIEGELKTHSGKVEKIRNSEMIKELMNLYEHGIEPMQVTDFSGALKGRHNIYDQLSMLIKNSKKSIELVTSEDGILRKIRTLKPLLEKAMMRGVKIRIIIPRGEIDDLSSETGLLEVKNDPSVYARFMIVDGTQIVFMLADDKKIHPSYDMGFWINSDFFCGALSKMFNQSWNAENITSEEKPNSDIEE